MTITIEDVLGCIALFAIAAAVLCAPEIYRAFAG